MGLAAKLCLMTDGDARGPDRAAIDREARLRRLGAFGRDVRVRNLSTDGFMAEADEYYEPGAYVWLKLPGVGDVHARVVWRDSFRYGFAFTTPLDHDQHAAAIAHDIADD